jgi:hypothetical protein
MTELQKYQMVNQCETQEDIINCISAFADENGEIQGRIRNFNAAKMCGMTKLYFNNQIEPNVLTREYGLRQQAMYIKYYTS